MSRKTICLILFVLLHLTASAQTQQQVNETAAVSYKKADTRLNALYQQVLKLYAKDATFLKNFRASQQAWLRFRDTQVAALFPKQPNENERVTYGSVYPTCYYKAMQELTEARNRQLQVWVTGIEEGDTCSGSIRAKR